jgi:hypothetical protein
MNFLLISLELNWQDKNVIKHNQENNFFFWRFFFTVKSTKNNLKIFLIYNRILNFLIHFFIELYRRKQLFLLTKISKITKQFFFFFPNKLVQ